MTEIRHLYLSFDGKVIFNDFSLNIKRGEKVAVIGESGKGKTTLLNILSGFTTDYKGRVYVFNKELNPENINEIRKDIAWLSQDTSTKERNVEELFFRPFSFAVNKHKKPSEKEIKAVFSTLHLDYSLMNKRVKNISGGQKQRILLASCLLLKKPLLLADEPTSALDEQVKRDITDFVLSQKELTVIAATHDDYWIRKSDKVIELK